MKFLSALVLMSLSLASSAVASEYLDETYYRCGDASGTGVGNFSSLNHVQGPMDRRPSWNFSYAARMQDPKTGYAKTEIHYCTVSQVIQVADGYEFRGNQCAVKVLQSSETIHSIQFNEEAAIANCKWDTDESNRPFNLALLLQAFADEGMPVTTATK